MCLTVVIAKPPSCRKHNNGWFTMRPTSRNGMIFSANTDPDLQFWLRSAPDGGNDPVFVCTVIESGSVSCSS